MPLTTTEPVDRVAAARGRRCLYRSIRAHWRPEVPGLGMAKFHPAGVAEYVRTSRQAVCRMARSGDWPACKAENAGGRRGSHLARGLLKVPRNRRQAR